MEAGLFLRSGWHVTLSTTRIFAIRASCFFIMFLIIIMLNIALHMKLTIDGLYHVVTLV